MLELQGKVALITGGARGIGLCIAIELLRNEVQGVALLDVDVANGRQTLDTLAKTFSKNRIIFVNADVTQRSQVEAAFEETIKTFKRLDIVINNAGIADEKEWEKCIAINLQGCITGSLLAIDKYFPKTIGTESEGVILNISSIAGLFPVQYLPVYSATKHGIIQFSRSISGPNRCRSLKIKVLTVCPGMTKTSMLNRNDDGMPEELKAIYRESVRTCPHQAPEELAQHAIEIMKHGNTGSIWKIEGNVRTCIEFPNLYSLP